MSAERRFEIQRHTSASPYEASIGFCRALRRGRRILVSGTAPIGPDGKAVKGAEAQARRCLEIIEGALQALGGGLSDVVRTRMFLVEAIRLGSRGTGPRPLFLAHKACGHHGGGERTA